MTTRRQALSQLSAAAAVTAFPALASAQDSWPNKPIRLIASSSPGSSTDVVSRLIADGLTQVLGQTVVVEAKPGAAGMVAAAEVARAPADGYTFVTIFGSYAANVTLNPQRTYKDSDLGGVAFVGSYPGLVVAHPSLPKTLAGIVQYAKAHPNELSYSSGGAGTLAHIKMAQWCHLAGIQMTHVPYKGGASAMTDLIAGRVHMTNDTISILKPQVEKGNLTAVGVDAPARHYAVPNVPTFVEQGYPDCVNEAWTAVAGHSGVPKAITKKMSDAINTVLKTDKVRGTLMGDVFGMNLKPMSPEQTDAFIAGEIKKWGDIIRQLKITAA